MNGYLRQSTASQVRTVGPFVDDVDFKTLENALTIANTDIKIKKNGAASANKNSGGATADGAGGLYHLTWDATDTSAVGELYFSIKVAGALVVFGSYVVLEEAVYDAFYEANATGVAATAATAAGVSAVETDTQDIQSRLPTALIAGRISADMTAISGDSVAADNLEKYTDGTEYMPVDTYEQKVSVSGGQLTAKKPDGTTSTAYSPRTVTSDANAEPIIGLS